MSTIYVNAVSATDYEQYQIILEAIARYGHQHVVESPLQLMYAGASERVRRFVEKAEICITLIGESYGYVETGQTYSLQEIAFRHAQETNKAHYVFVLPTVDKESQDTAYLNFIRFVRRTGDYQSITTDEDFRKSIDQILYRDPSVESPTQPPSIVNKPESQPTPINDSNDNALPEEDKIYPDASTDKVEVVPEPTLTEPSDYQNDVITSVTDDSDNADGETSHVISESTGSDAILDNSPNVEQTSHVDDELLSDDDIDYDVQSEHLPPEEPDMDELLEDAHWEALPDIPSIPNVTSPLIGQDETINTILGRLGCLPDENTQNQHLYLYSFPGMGLTHIAHEIAHHPNVQAKFPDGIMWSKMGANRSLFYHFVNLTHQLGFYGLTYNTTLSTARDTVAQVFQDRKVLLIIDDVVDVNIALQLIDIVNLESSVLLLTHDYHIVERLALTETDMIVVEPLEQHRAHDLVQHHHPTFYNDVKDVIDTLPSAIIQHPLLLLSVSNFLYEYRDDETRYNQILQTVRQADAPVNYANPDLSDYNFDYTVHILRQLVDSLDVIERQLFIMLHVFAPYPALISTYALSRIWQRDDVTAITTKFVRLGLLIDVVDGVYSIRDVFDRMAASYQAHYTADDRLTVDIQSVNELFASHYFRRLYQLDKILLNSDIDDFMRGIDYLEFMWEQIIEAHSWVQNHYESNEELAFLLNLFPRQTQPLLAIHQSLDEMISWHRDGYQVAINTTGNIEDACYHLMYMGLLYTFASAEQEALDCFNEISRVLPDGEDLYVILSHALYDAIEQFDDTTTQLQSIQKAIDAAVILDDLNILALLHQFAGFTHMRAEQLEHAIVSFTEALTFARKMNNVMLQYQLYLQMIDLNHRLGHLDLAYDQSQALVDLTTQMDSAALQELAYAKLCYTQYLDNDTTAAIESMNRVYYLRSLYQRTLLPDRERNKPTILERVESTNPDVIATARECDNLWNLARYFLFVGMLGDAVAALKRAHDYAKRINDQVSQVEIALEAIPILIQLWDTDEALRWGNEALSISETSSNRHDIARSWAAIGNIHEAAGRTSMAVRAWRDATEIYRQLNDREQIRGLYHKLLSVSQETISIDDFEENISEYERAKRRYAQYYMQTLESLAKPVSPDVDLSQVESSKFVADWHQIKHAHRWATSNYNTDPIAYHLMKRYGIPSTSYLVLNLTTVEATTWLDTSSDFATLDDDLEDQIILMLARAELYMRSGRNVEAIALYKQVRTTARRIQSYDILLTTYASLGAAHLAIGQLPIAQQYLEEAQQYFDRTNNNQVIVSVLQVSLVILMHIGDFENAYEIAERALELNEEPLIDVIIKLNKGLLLASMDGHEDEGMTLLYEIQEIAEYLDLTFVKSQSQAIFVLIHTARLRFEEAIETGERALQMLSETGDTRIKALVVVGLTTTYVNLQRYEDASRMIEIGIDLVRTTNDQLNHVRLLMYRCFIDAVQGNLNEADQLMRQAYQMGMAIEYPLVIAMAGYLQFLIYFLRQDYDAIASNSYNINIEQLDGVSRLQLIQILLYSMMRYTDRETLTEYISDLLDSIDAPDVDPQFAKILEGHGILWRGMLLLEEDDLDQANMDFSRARQILEPYKSFTKDAHGALSYGLGRLAVINGNNGTAETYLQDAIVQTENGVLVPVRLDAIDALTDLYGDAGRYEDTIPYLQLAEEISERFELTARRGEYLHILGKIYQNTKRYDEALATYKRARQLYQSLNEQLAVDQLDTLITTIENAMP